MNEMPYVIPNFMPFTENMPNMNQNDIKKDLDRIYHELENIEKRLAIIENNMNIKTSSYLSSNVDTGKGLYML